MPDREKVEHVINAFERVIEVFDGRISGPYFEAWMCATKDALALLKAQEPRVMTLEEAKAAEGYIWEECCDTNILHVNLQRNGFSLEAFEEPFPLNLMNWEGYGKEWRYWTSRPTEAEREATPWN